MNKTVPFISSLAVIFSLAATAMGQAGAPTQRVHIPGIPDGTSIYPKSLKLGDNFVSIGCVSKSANGEFLITDWRGSAEKSVDGAPTMAARPPMVVRLQSNQGNQDMLNFQVGHEVQISGSIVETPEGSRLPALKPDSILYLSQTCWTRGTNSTDPANSKPKP
jgi:hypothetical protein